jgi:hypothetical protein
MRLSLAVPSLHVSIAIAINISVTYKNITNPRIRNIRLGYPDVDRDGDWNILVKE